MMYRKIKVKIRTIKITVLEKDELDLLRAWIRASFQLLDLSKTLLVLPLTYIESSSYVLDWFSDLEYRGE